MCPAKWLTSYPCTPLSLLNLATFWRFMEKYYLVLVSVIPGGFPHYWITGGLWQTPFYLTFIAWQDFSHMPFPHPCPAYFHSALPIKFFWILLLAWEHGVGAGGGSPLPIKLFLVKCFGGGCLIKQCLSSNFSLRDCLPSCLFLY